MDKMRPWVQVVVGLLIALSGDRGVAVFEPLWLKVLFLVVALSGLWSVAMGWRRRTAA